MVRFVLVSLVVFVGFCDGVHALAGSGDSPVGALETVPPNITALTAAPAEAAAGDNVVLTFDASEDIPLMPSVTINGEVANFANSSKATSFEYEYTIQQTDPLGAAAIEIVAADAVGNTTTVNDSTALNIIDAAAGVPIVAWPAALALLLAGVLALTFRSRKASVEGGSKRIFFLFLAALLAAPTALALGPSVTNVAFTQQPTPTGTEVVITYDLVSPFGPSDITVSLSKEGDDNFAFPVSSVTGNLTGVSTGTGHTITWDIAADYPNEEIPGARLRVTADDGFIVPPVEMVSVPAVSFEMGNSGVGDDAAFGQALELPVHTVTLSAYEIGKFEVTNQQVCDVFNWAADQGLFTTVDASTAQAFGQTLLNLGFSDCNIEYVGGVFQPETRTGLPGATSYSMADHPVQRISWYGAVAFCNWLSEIEGRTPVYDTGTWAANFANDGYHLPTEAQWERAAAWDGTKHWIYGFTSDTLTGKNRANYRDVNPDYVNPLGLTAFPYTSPVGWFNGSNVSPNGGIATVDSVSPVGAYDMSGNASEWCHDRLGIYPSGSVTDPEGAATGSTRVIRGGGWNDNGSRFCRSANREGDDPEGLFGIHGFRPARNTSYSLTYTAGVGGTLTGDASQTVLPGGDGTPVEAVPDSGFIFVDWSDGVTDNLRTDTNVSRGIDVTANFDWLGSVPELISVPAGSFDMGRTDHGDDATFGGSNESPVHTVTLSAYEIGKFEVTNQQVCDVFNWAADQGLFTTVDASTAQAFGQTLLGLGFSDCNIEYVGGVFQPKTGTGLPGATSYSMADHPVQRISWYGAVAYCNWLSEIDGLTPVYDTGTWEANFANDGYHLPTEAQWERAAAWDGSQHWIYSFTSDTLTGKNRANYFDSTPSHVNPLGLTGLPYTSPVGWFDGSNVSPNGSITTVDSVSPIGAYDMSGNVWELCHDWYDSGYYTVSPGTDPTGAASSPGRVIRGGSSIDYPNFCRSARRQQNAPSNMSFVIGFRLAR